MINDYSTELSQELCDQIKNDREIGWINPYRSFDKDIIRRENRLSDKETVLRPAYVRDIEKILHIPVYNRYTGKTQVFSFRSNDDLSRRGLHVQLVSRIARDISQVLGLNVDLTEAIALGHDIGHTPFGHVGERCLNDVFHRHTGRFFAHNVHSVRVLDVLYGRNISFQTLDGVLCHNGEYEQRILNLSGDMGFNALDCNIQNCLKHGNKAIKSLCPATLEGCVVRISDIIAYVGRDRKDAVEAGLVCDEDFERDCGGAYNSWILSHALSDIVEHSYRQNRIMMSKALFDEIKRAKAENYRVIYQSSAVEGQCVAAIAPAFERMYEKFLNDLRAGDESSYIFRHHINRVNKELQYYGKTYDWQNDLDQTCVDYLSSMTDDYFIELSSKLFKDLEFPLRSYINEHI